MKNWLLSHPRLNPYLISKIGFGRAATSFLRVPPNFLIIGAEKAGTTSLYDYLTQHPAIIPAITKEIHYFDINFIGFWWYKSHFPTIFQKNSIIRKYGKFITGEATPHYLFHPLAPKRISQILPNVKLIVILRNPIDRAYSHYQEIVRKNLENLSFEEAIKKENERLEGEKEKILSNPKYNSSNYWVYSYLSTGIYIQQLKTWFDFFSKNQFLTLKTEDLENHPEQVLNEIFSFLDVRNCSITNFKKMNVGTYDKMESYTRKYLQDYYSHYNKELETLLNMKFEWS